MLAVGDHVFVELAPKNWVLVEVTAVTPTHVTVEPVESDQVMIGKAKSLVLERAGIVWSNRKL